MSMNDSEIKNSQFIQEKAKKFVYGKKQRDFAYLQRRNFSKINPMPTYLQHTQLIDVVCCYKGLVFEHILDKKEEESKYDKYVAEQDVSNQNKAGYLNWDRKQIMNYAKLTTKENRTV